jgi:hypothetical protein
MPGCHRALAGDLDGDGDHDVVAVAMLNFFVIQRFGAEQFDGVCWLEQTSPGNYQRHTLENSACDHPALELADFDSDGDVDMAVANFFPYETQMDPVPSLTLWWNETQPLPSGAAELNCICP